MTASPPTVPVAGTVAHRGLARRDVRLLLAVAVAGSAAASLANPVLWLTTAGVVVLLLVAGLQAGAPPVAVPDAASHAPLALRRAMDLSATGLPDGDARRLLDAVIRQAEAFFGQREPVFDEREESEARRHVGDLLDAASGVAAELARIDRAFPESAPPGSDAALLARAQSTRALFSDRLRDAAATLATLYAADVENGTPATDRVAELVRDIRADAAARGQARAELRKLLGTHENTSR